VAVKVGQISQHEVAILSGITKEDHVVTAAQFLKASKEGRQIRLLYLRVANDTKSGVSYNFSKGRTNI